MRFRIEHETIIDLFYRIADKNYPASVYLGRIRIVSLKWKIFVVITEFSPQQLSLFYFYMFGDTLGNIWVFIGQNYLIVDTLFANTA